MLDQRNTKSGDVSPLRSFEMRLRKCPDVRAELKAGLVGKDIEIPGAFGPRKLVYADYVASGRALTQIERFVSEDVLPFYANSHTEASFCGRYMTRMREDARQVILEKCGGRPEQHAAIFAGSGATTGLNKLVHLFGIRDALARGENVSVLVGPYEHHSNLLPWRESGASVIQVDEAAAGGPDPDHLRKTLASVAGSGLVIAAFSAASNITGICCDVTGITEIVKRAGGLIVWDFAGGGPYLDIDMLPGSAAIDAVVFSPHKFIGGPGASGVLIVRRDAVVADRPNLPGGGTVAFVNDRVHDYLSRIEDREEGGTPNIAGDIRAGLVMIVKDALSQDFIARRNRELTRRAVETWKKVPNINLLGGLRVDRLPIFSFIVSDLRGRPIDYQLFTRALSDFHGIQARGGCACAGPYAHRLLNISRSASDKLRTEILAGDESHKPGFVRLNLSVLMDDDEVDFILKSTSELASDLAGADFAIDPLKNLPFSA